MPRALSLTWIYIIGGMCYSIYLLHYAVISLVGPATMKVQLGSGYFAALAVQVVVLGLVILVMSAVFFVLIERPCMDPSWPNQARDWLQRRFPKVFGTGRARSTRARGKRATRRRRRGRRRRAVR